MKSKKGFINAGLAVLVLVAILAAFAGPTIKGAWDNMRDDEPAELEIGSDNDELPATVEEKNLQSCDGIASVKSLLDDLNAYKSGTDPASHLTFFEMNGEEYKKVVADDATSTTIPVLSTFKGLAGNNIGTPLSSYFAEEIDVVTVCSDVEIQPDLYPASVPTMTVTNDNGKTVNSDSDHETVVASTTYSPCVTIKSPSEACSARYGAIVSAEYDASYVTKVSPSSSSLKTTGFDGSFLVAHTTNHSAIDKDMDQYKVMKWTDTDGKLCESESIELCFDVTMGGSNPGEDQGNVIFNWYPINKDLDADSLDVILGIYDEDNNLISQAYTNATWHTA